MAEPDRAAHAAEAAAIRRRWITLGEVLAAAAVLISGLTFWNSYSERRAAEQERDVEKARTVREAANLILQARPDPDGTRLILSSPEPDVAIQSLSFRFPAQLGIDSVETVVDPRIEARWFEVAARRIARRGQPDAGDHLLPVLITTRFTRGGAMHLHGALYDIGYQVEPGGLFDDRDVVLKGLAQVARVPGGRGQSALNALWTQRQPTISSAEKK